MDQTDRLPRQAEFYRIALAKMQSYSRKWGVDRDTISVTFVLPTDPRNRLLGYFVAAGKKRQFFKNGVEAPMPVLEQERIGVSHGRQYRTIRKNGSTLGPYTFDGLAAMMEACPDYTPPRMAAD